MTCESSLNLDLRFLLKNGYLKKGQVTTMSLSWSSNGRPTGNISAIGCMDEKWIRLIFSVTNKRSGEKTDYNYKINLVGVPSNLGQGEVLYFVCPSTGRRCRVLYSANGEHCFFSRFHYERKGMRLLYNSQCYSKNDYSNSRYHAIDRQLEKYYSNRQKAVRGTYKGKVTRERIKILRLEGKQMNFNIKRMQIFSSWIEKKTTTLMP